MKNASLCFSHYNGLPLSLSCPCSLLSCPFLETLSITGCITTRLRLVCGASLYGKMCGRLRAGSSVEVIRKPDPSLELFKDRGISLQQVLITMECAQAPLSGAFSDWETESGAQTRHMCCCRQILFWLRRVNFRLCG